MTNTVNTNTINAERVNTVKNVKQIRALRRFSERNARGYDHYLPKINEHQLVRDVLRLRNNLSHVNNRMIHLTQSLEDHVDRCICWGVFAVAVLIIIILQIVPENNVGFCSGE